MISSAIWAVESRAVLEREETVLLSDFKMNEEKSELFDFVGVRILSIVRRSGVGDGSSSSCHFIWKVNC